MKLKVINGTTFDIEKKVNDFLSNLATNDIYKVETISLCGAIKSGSISVIENRVAVLIWTKA